MRKTWTSRWMAPCLALLGLCATSCSAILEFEGECLTDQGCETLGERLICVDERCVSDTSADPPLPAQITSEECDTLLGAPDVATLRGEDYVLFGALVPRSGVLGEARSSIEAALATALADINQSGGVYGTKLAVLACDEGRGAPDVALRAARHLVENLRVDAIIGASLTPITVPVLQDVARPRSVLLLAPGSRSPALSNLPDDGLLWRAEPPSDLAAQAAALALREQGPDKVLVLFDEGSWGTSTAAVFNAEYCAGANELCSDARFSGVGFNTGVSANQIELAVSAFAPDRTVVIANPDDQTQVLAGVAATEHRATLTIDGVRSQLNALLQLDDGGMTSLAEVTYAPRLELACQHLGISARGIGPAYDSWRFDFDAKNSGAAVTRATPVYADSVYVLGYALAAARSLSDAAISGPRLADGLKRLSGGRQITIGAGDWPTGIAVLASSKSATIDYLGASGDLQFDSRTGDAEGAAQAWRFNRTARQAQPAGTVLLTGGDLTPVDDSLVEEDCACAPFRPSARCCGDGTTQPGEDCDDGNTADGDGCSSTCANE